MPLPQTATGDVHRHQASAWVFAAFDDVPCIGDGLRDLQAAAAAGGRPMLVLTGWGATTLAGVTCRPVR